MPSKPEGDKTMTTDKNYNGWTNYATWRVNLEMFDGMSPRELKQQGVKEYIKLHELPACVTVDDSGLLAKVTINL